MIGDKNQDHEDWKLSGEPWNFLSEEDELTFQRYLDEVNGQVKEPVPEDF